MLTFDLLLIHIVYLTTSDSAFLLRSLSRTQMSNIHGLNDYRPQRDYPRQGGGGGVQQPFMIEERGLSMMSPPPRADGKMPELSDRILPYNGWKTATTALCLLDALLFIVTLIVGASKFDGAFVKGNNMGGPSATTLEYMGGKYTPDIQEGQVWRLFTAIVLHAGIMHLASNTFFQLRFGFVLEKRWGIARFLGVYVLSGLMASLFSAQLSKNNVSVGASGALFGLVGADMTYLAYNWVEIPHKESEACFVAFVTLINFLLGIDKTIDNWAHFGGLVGGLFLGIGLAPHLVQRPSEIWFKAGAWFVYCGLWLMFLLLIFVGK